jgi:hypothetical protein
VPQPATPTPRGLWAQLPQPGEPPAGSLAAQVAEALVVEGRSYTHPAVEGGNKCTDRQCTKIRALAPFAANLTDVNATARTIL